MSSERASRFYFLPFGVSIKLKANIWHFVRKQRMRTNRIVIVVIVVVNTIVYALLDIEIDWNYLELNCLVYLWYWHSWAAKMSFIFNVCNHTGQSHFTVIRLKRRSDFHQKKFVLTLCSSCDCRWIIFVCNNIYKI